MFVKNVKGMLSSNRRFEKLEILIYTTRIPTEELVGTSIKSVTCVTIENGTLHLNDAFLIVEKETGNDDQCICDV